MVEKITTRQMILFIIATRISIAISNMPAINLPPYNHDIWIMVLFSIVYTCIVMIPLLYLANNFTEDSIVGYTKKIFGKFIGRIIGVLYALFFIITSINGITIQSELVATSFLVDTSNIVIIGIMMITCIYLVTKGIKSILLLSELLAPVALFITTSILIIGLFKIDFSIFQPILKYSSLQDMNIGAIKLTFLYTDIFLLTMISPELENKKDINKIFLVTTIVSLSFLALAIIVTFGSLGVEQARHSNFPFLLYTRSIKDIKLLERVDPVFVIGWVIANLFRIVGFLYLATRAIREILNRNEKEKYILFFVGGVSSLVSIFILNQGPVVGIRKGFNIFYNIIFVIFTIIIPILTCLVYLLRKKPLK